MEGFGERQRTKPIISDYFAGDPTARKRKVTQVLDEYLRYFWGALVLPIFGALRHSQGFASPFGP